jgi:hypothetical protein
LPSIFFLIFCNCFFISSFLYYSVFMYFFLSFLLFLNCLAVLFPLDLYHFQSFSCLPLLSISPCRFHPSLSGKGTQMHVLILDTNCPLHYCLRIWSIVAHSKQQYYANTSYWEM